MNIDLSWRDSIQSWLLKLEQPTSPSTCNAHWQDRKLNTITSNEIPSPSTSSLTSARDKSPPKRRRFNPRTSEHDEHVPTIPSRPNQANQPLPTGTDDQNDDGQALTPRGSIQSLILSPPHPPSSKISFNSDKSSSQPSKCSTNPVETTQTLRLLEKPVYYRDLNDRANEQLSPDIHELWRRVYAIASYNLGIYPAEIKERIIEALGRENQCPPNHLWAEHGDVDDYHHGSSHVAGASHDSNRVFLKREYDQLSEIEHEAWRSSNLRRSEAAWNSLVHVPLLRLALQGHHWRRHHEEVSSSSSPPAGEYHGQHPRIALEPCMTARIAPSFVPRGSIAGPDWSASKTVDIVLGLRLDPVLKPDSSAAGGAANVNFVSNAAAQDPARDADMIRSRISEQDDRIMKVYQAIREKIITQPFNEAFINQTQYAPLTEIPIAISIETKTDMTSEEEARVQLGVWTAAWHARISRLLGPSKIITLPLLIAVGHQWKLYFACDRGDQGIEIYGSLDIGGSGTLLSLYKFLAVICHLADWMENDYLVWLGDIFNITSLST